MTTPAVSIGIPIYNGEEFLKRRFDSILNQTIQNFEVIISNNASTDSTEKICQEYVKNDSRFRYFKQDENIGVYQNFYFVLTKAVAKYFVWASDDDLWTPDFLEKNMRVLDSNDKIICSIGLVGRTGPPINEFKPALGDSLIIKIYKKIRRSFRPFGSFPITGDYGKRIRTYLKNLSSHDYYGIHRIEILKKSMPGPSDISWDCALMINLIKYGEIHVIDKVLLYYNTQGMSSSVNIKENIKHVPIGAWKQFSFPWTFFGYWCLKKLGLKLFIKNLDRFMWLTCLDIAAILVMPIKLVLENKK